MEIVHNQNSFLSLNKAHKEKRLADSLRNAEKELLHQMAETFTLIYGGQFKSRRQSA